MIGIWMIGLQIVTPYGVICGGLNLTPQLWSLGYCRDTSSSGSVSYRFLVFFFACSPLPTISEMLL